MGSGEPCPHCGSTKPGVCSLCGKTWNNCQCDDEDNPVEECPDCEGEL